MDENILIGQLYSVTQCIWSDMGWEHVIPQFIVKMKTYCNTSVDKIKFPIQGTGRNRSFVFIDDFVDGLMRVIESGTNLEIYHIGTMDEIPIEQVAIEIAKYFEREIVIIPGNLLKEVL